MQASRPSSAWLTHPGAIAFACGCLGFAFSALFAPPPPLVAFSLSLPFFYYAAQSRWKDCIVWIIATIPFQYYFNIGGLSLTHTELYLFAFGAAYLFSRGYKEKSVLLPAALIVPAWYGLSQFTVVATGHADLAKQAVRTLAAVFFCPRRPASASPSMS